MPNPGSLKPSAKSPSTVVLEKIPKKNPAIKTTGLKTYDELKRRVRLALAEGDSRAQAAYEQEQVRAKWQAGKLIQEHILLNKERAKYGEQVILRLSKDLGTSQTELLYMVEFAKAYPISRPAGKLSWSAYQALLRINEPEEREKLAKEAVRRQWTRDTVRQEVVKLKAAKQITVAEIPEKEEPILAKKGKLYTYQIVTTELGPWKGKPVIDLGFSNYYRPQEEFKFKAGDFVESIKTPKGYSLTKVNASLDSLFTYEVHIKEVLDGDTFWVHVDLGFGFTTKQRLRLKWLDAPEIQTASGLDSKKYFERLLSFPRKRESSTQTLVIIKSTKDDNYGRYLADLWAGDTYLNQKLIDKGFAVRTPE